MNVLGARGSFQFLRRPADAAGARRCLGIAMLVLATTHAMVATAAPAEVAMAGLAYSGSQDSVADHFHYSQDYVRAVNATETPISARLFRQLSAAPSTDLQIVQDIPDLAGRDRALTVALVLSSETVSVDRLGDLYKLLVLIRANTVFFDAKSMKVLRSYPIKFAYVDVLPHAPTEEDKRARVKLVYEGAGGKPGLLERFVQAVAKARLPSDAPLSLQVTSVQIAPDVVAALPDYIKSSPQASQAWAADLVSEDISSRAEVPILPYLAQGFAGGRLLQIVGDNRVWELQLPKPDYQIKVELTAFKKIKFSEVQGGATSFVYGSFANVSLDGPLGSKLNTGLKNGITVVIPASQNSQVDDFQHYYDALNGLFEKLGLAINGNGDPKWLKSAAAAPDIDKQLSQTQALIRQCK